MCIAIARANNYKTDKVVNLSIDRSYALTPSTDFMPIIFELICVNLSENISKTAKLTVTGTPLRSSVEAGETIIVGSSMATVDVGSVEEFNW